MKEDISEYLKIQFLRVIRSHKEQYSTSRAKDIVEQLIRDQKVEEDGTLRLEKFAKLEKLQFFCALVEFYLASDEDRRTQLENGESF